MRIYDFSAFMIDGITITGYPHYHMDCDLQTITQHLLQSYEEIGGINHFDGTNLPSKLSVERFCEELLSLIFPGFHDEAAMHSSSLESETTQRIFRLITTLKAEVCALSTAPLPRLNRMPPIPNWRSWPKPAPPAPS